MDFNTKAIFVIALVQSIFIFADFNGFGVPIDLRRSEESFFHRKGKYQTNPTYNYSINLSTLSTTSLLQSYHVYVGSKVLHVFCTVMPDLASFFISRDLHFLLL